MPKTIEVDEVRRLLDEGAQLVDVMSRTAYENSRLPGAIHLSLKELNAQSAAQLDPGRPVIVYCADYL